MSDDMNQDEELAQRWYLEPLLAFLHGRLGEDSGKMSTGDLIQAGQDAELRLYKFKRKRVLPRVTKAIGILCGIAPSELLDIGSGRGTALWPMLDQLPDLPITAVDTSTQRASDLELVAQGIERLSADQADACDLPFADDTFDASTALEVLEHMPQPSLAAAELLRVSRRFVVVSVPSHEDDNPEHVQMFTRDTLTTLFMDAGASGVEIDAVHNHLIGVVKR